MKPGTVEALDRINRRFYATSGSEFSATRRSPWPTWSVLVDRLLELRAPGHAPHSILDVGCGNGRFGSLLEAPVAASWRYTGIDASLSLAREALAATEPLKDRRIVAADVVCRRLPFDLRAPSFDLIVVFGLMHHVPSWERRRSLLVDLARLLHRGGVLAVSFWQFGREERFARRILDWSEYNAVAREKVDLDDLEPGDQLLRWGDGQEVRYCHFADPVEAAELTAASGLQRVETLRGDGASGSLNLYHLMRRS